MEHGTISIFTRTNDRRTFEYWRYLIGTKLLRRTRGPNAVLESLQRGLRTLGISYTVNPTILTGRIAVVLSGKRALHDAIENKRNGDFDMLFAGPNIVVDPRDANGIITDPAVDRILVPSRWVADLWASQSPEIKKRIYIWPSGVSSNEPSQRAGLPILYIKTNDEKLIEKTRALLENSWGKIMILQYGTFKHAEYLSALTDAPFLVYLGSSESQGLALQEAWSCDVPTFVHAVTAYRHGATEWTDPMIAAPYLANSSGAFFDDLKTLAKLLAGDLREYSPKKHFADVLTDAGSAKRLLSLRDHEK